MSDELRTRVEKFAAAVKLAGGRVTLAASGFEVAAHIESVVRADGTGRAVLHEPSPLAEELGLPLALRARGIDLVAVPQAGSRIVDARVGLTDAALGVAESGTLLVGGRPGGWGLATVLPWIHVAVLRAVDLVDDLAAGFARFEQRFAAGEREWVWITGPSKTADIAKTLVMGIHGPNTLEIIVLDDSPASVARS